MHGHIARIEERARDLDRIEHFPALGIRIWAKYHPTLRIHESAYGGRWFRHRAWEEGEAS